MDNLYDRYNSMISASTNIYVIIDGFICVMNILDSAMDATNRVAVEVKINLHVEFNERIDLSMLTLSPEGQPCPQSGRQVNQTCFAG